MVTVDDDRTMATARVATTFR